MAWPVNHQRLRVDYERDPLSPPVSYGPRMPASYYAALPARPGL